MSYANKGGFDPADSPDPNDAPLDFEAIGAEEAIEELREAQRNAVQSDAAQSEQSAAWDADLPRNPKTGTLKNSFRVLCTILRSSPEFLGRLWWSEMLLRPMLDDQQITEASTGALREEIERRFGIEPSVQNVRAAIITGARETPRNSAREWLLALPAWDGIKRLARVPKHVLGTSDELAPRLFARFCISAVARAFDPGCKADCALVLAGPQGMRKSTFFALLAGEFFSDADIDIQNKDSVLQLYASWITEWSEIERVTSKKDASIVKAWLSRKDDLVRLPYGSAVEKFPRSSVIVGSTNKPDFLNDETGDRRFWIIEIQGRINTDLLKEWRDQLWAEAVAAYRANEPWWLTEKEELRRDRDARFYRKSDPWEPLVEQWIKKSPTLDFVTTADVLTQALQMKSADIRTGHEMRVGVVMRAFGWEPCRPRRNNPENKRGFQRPKVSFQPSDGAESSFEQAQSRIADAVAPTAPTLLRPSPNLQSRIADAVAPTAPTAPGLSRTGAYSGNTSISQGSTPSSNSPSYNETDGAVGAVGADRQYAPSSCSTLLMGRSERSEQTNNSQGSKSIDFDDAVSSFVTDCTKAGSSLSELFAVVAVAYDGWTATQSFTMTHTANRARLARCLEELGFTIVDETVYGLSIKDEWTDALNAAEDALERAAIVAEADAIHSQGAKQ